MACCASVVLAQPPAAVKGTGDSAKAEAGAPLLGNFGFVSKDDPIAVTADSMEFDYRNRVLVYKGRVVVTQADLKLESDTLRVQLDTNAGGLKADGQDPSGSLKEVAAIGKVRLEKGARWATAGKAVFDQERRTVVLTENALLHDGDNQISGDRLTVYLDEERSVVEGGKGRVKAVLYPKSTEGTKQEAGQ